MRVFRLILACSITIVVSFLLPTLKAFSVSRFARGSHHCVRNTRRYSSAEASEEDILRWEQMYNSGESSNSMQDDAIEYYVSASEVRVVTFDLDNTLWKTSATISAANDALAEFLEEHDIVQPTRVEKVMGELFQASKERYSPNGGKAPVFLTSLRKDAIRHVLQEHNGYSEQNATELVEKSFDAWTSKRHDVIPSHFASEVVSCLETIRSIRTSSGQPVLIGAITDGNSDPRNVTVLSDLFDFCVNAEGVGVSKPDKRVYQEAMQQVTSHPFVQDIFGDLDGEQDVEDVVGPWWVHVGDDFIKDVVPAKEFKMRSIWARELVSKGGAPVEKPKLNKTMEEFVKEISGKKVIEMSVGAEDYLADSIRGEFADAVIDDFAELGNILSSWQDVALRLAESRSANVAADVVTEVTDTAASGAERPAINGAQANGESQAQEMKFCVYCGTKVPKVAKFCSACGEKQPELST